MAPTPGCERRDDRTIGPSDANREPRRDRCRYLSMRPLPLSQALPPRTAPAGVRCFAPLYLFARGQGRVEAIGPHDGVTHCSTPAAPNLHECAAKFMSEWASTDYERVQFKPWAMGADEYIKTLNLVKGFGDQDKLVPAGEHSFRTDDGQIRFEVADGRAVSFEFKRDSGGSLVGLRR